MKMFKSDDPNTFHYITAVAFKRVPLFRSEQICRILIEVIAEIRGIHPFKLIGYVIMPDHVHLILNPLRPEISTILRKLKGKSARKIVDALRENGEHLTLKKLEIDVAGRQYAVWQKDSSAIDLFSGKFIRQKLGYIHMNPVRAGLCNHPARWEWSSCLAYMNHEPGSVPIEIDQRPYWSIDEINGTRETGGQARL